MTIESASDDYVVPMKGEKL